LGTPSYVGPEGFLFLLQNLITALRMSVGLPVRNRDHCFIRQQVSRVVLCLTCIRKVPDSKPGCGQVGHFPSQSTLYNVCSWRKCVTDPRIS